VAEHAKYFFWVLSIAPAEREVRQEEDRFEGVLEVLGLVAGSGG
jgi:hypothetical protein